VAVMPSSVQAFQLEGVAYREIENVPDVELAVAWMRGDHSALLHNFLEVVVTATAGATALAPAPGHAPFPTDERLTHA
jgi:hypothetical protein